MSNNPSPTQILTEIAAGKHGRANEFLSLVYTQLHQIAECYMQRERADHVLQPTALVHEAYLKMVDQTQIDWKGRTHFLAVAANAMQRVLIDQARARDRQKRGGGENKWRKVSLEDAYSLAASHELGVLELEDALNRMKELDERQAKIATLRLFGELDDEQIAELLTVSKRTVERDWKMAKAWLRRELRTANDRTSELRQDDQSP